MSQVIDTKVVEMQFDNSKFEKNIEVSLNSLKNLNKSIDDAGKNRGSLDELAKAGDQVGLSFDNMNMKSKISLNLFDMLSGVGTKAFNRISDAVAGFALNMANSLSGMQAMRDGFNEYELKMGSVQTILAGAKIKDPLNTKKWVTDDARRLEIVNKQLAKLNDYSDKTIYSFKDMTSNIGKFTNAGVDLESSVQAIQGVANVAAISGANANEASRAMYNFSQALSSGAVKLIDWKSIENANMATQGFKQQLLDTALALGTVEKQGKKYVSTTTDANGKVSDAFNTTKMFNDSLSHQWMTTEVLTQTLKNYSTDVRDMSDNELENYRKELLKIGYTQDQVTNIIETSRKAFEAATEVKTFTQMIDTLKESLGSGWAQTFEIVIGDFMEAKKLFTELNNTIDNLLSPIGKARNAILQTWKDNGGRDALINSFKNLYHAVENILEPVKQLWKAFTPNTAHAGKGLAVITKGLEKVTAAARKGGQVVGNILATVLKPVIFIGSQIGKLLLRLYGYISKTIGPKVMGFFSSVGKALNNFSTRVSTVIDKHIISKLKSFQTTLTTTFANVKKRLKESKALESLIKAFNDLRIIIHDLFNRVIVHAMMYANHFSLYLKRIWEAISPLVSNAFTSALRGLSNVILPKFRKVLEFVTEKLKDFGSYIGKLDITKSRFYKTLAGLPERIKAIGDNKTFKNVFSGIKNFGSEAVTYLSDKFVSLKNNLESIKMPSGLKDVFENVKNFIKGIFGEDSVSGAISKPLEETADAVDKVTGEDSGRKLTAFQKFLEGVSNAFEWLKNAAMNAKNAIKNFIDFIVTNTPKAFKAIYNFVAGDDGILKMSDITDVLFNISDALSPLLSALGVNSFGKAASNFSEAFGDISESITTLLKRTSNRVQMASLRDFAIAVGILSGALFLLAQLPTEKLLTAGTVIVALGYSLSKFFGLLSNGSITPWKVAGNLSIAALLLSIGGAMVGIAASIGILVLALKAFPWVIKQYNNLGDQFKTGMERVKKVLEEIFEYLDHAASSKYSFRSAMALLGLVTALGMLRKTIVKFANKKTGEAMADGLARIKEVLDLLGNFLSSISLASFSFINIGIDFDTLGMAAMIWALGNMMNKIAPTISELAKLKPKEYRTAFKALDTIFFELGAFMAGASLLSKFTKTGLGQWLGMGAVITLLASTISSIVSSLKTLAGLATGNREGFKKGLDALDTIFLELGGVLAIAGYFKPEKVGGTLFALSVTIGALTACVVALVPLAESHPGALTGSVIALGALMVALGGALLLAGKAGGNTKTSDIVKLIVMTGAMVVLAQAIRRLARSGGDAGSIVVAAAAISGAALAMAGAMKIIGSIEMINPLVLGGLFLLTAAIWGIVFAIRAFKGSSGDVQEGSKAVKAGIENMGDGANEAISNLGMSLDISGLIDSIGSKIGEKIKNFDLGAHIRKLIESVKADAINWAQDFIDIGTNIVSGISTAISDPANVEKVKEGIVQLGQALLESFRLFLGIHSPSTVMIEQGGYVIDGLVQGLMEYPAKLAEWVSGIGSFILSGISSLFTGAIEKGRGLVDSVGAGIQNGKDAVSKKASEIGRAALDKVGKAKEWAGKALESANSFGAKLRASKNPIAKAAGTMITGATGAIKGIGGIFKKASSDASSKFATSLNSGKGPVKAAASALVTGAKSAFHGIANSFRTFGKNAAEGFRNGINNMISSIANKARELVRRAKEAAKSEQHSNSPSKDFMEYGGWAAQGYALGMTNRKNSRLIEKNAQKMVDTAKNAVSISPFGASFDLDSNPAISSLAYAVSQISGAVDGSIDSNLTIRPIVDMSDVNRSAYAISSIFGDRRMGASVNVMESVQSDFDRLMYNKTNAYQFKSIDKLSSKLDDITNTMNSRSLNVYNTIDGSADPEAFADGLIRSFRLNARTI